MTLDSDVLPLGYKRIARETTLTISENIKAELQELNEIYNNLHDNVVRHFNACRIGEDFIHNDRSGSQWEKNQMSKFHTGYKELEKNIYLHYLKFYPHLHCHIHVSAIVHWFSSGDWNFESNPLFCPLG